MEGNGSKNSRRKNAGAMDKNTPCTLVNENGNGVKVGSLREQIFPCKSDEEIRLALEKLLFPVRIEVAGGIVRHNIW